MLDWFIVERAERREDFEWALFRGLETGLVFIMMFTSIAET
jgi:hypothetical protein